LPPMAGVRRMSSRPAAPEDRPSVPAGRLFSTQDSWAHTRVTASPPKFMRLLCADDEEDIRTILQLALSLDPELEVELVDSGEAALARARAAPFDAILLDGMMPGMDGYETCRRLKADPATAQIPILFLTAKTQRTEIEQALTLGAVACLMKPFDPMTLAAELRAALRG
jgi:two-component system, OmpR family, response regulator